MKFQIPMMLAVVAILSVGQVCFKLAAARVPELKGPMSLIKFIFEPVLFAALVLYGVGTVLYVLVLKHAELSVAQSFIALSFALTPLLAMIFLGEKLNWANFVGMILIIAGVYVIARYAPGQV